MGDSPRFFRQGTTWSAIGGDCEVLLTEPGVQGIITQETQVAVLASQAPNSNAPQALSAAPGSTLGSRSEAAPFNTDSFLTASLGLGDSDEEDEDDFRDPHALNLGGSSSSQGSLSASSGSLTPRVSTSPVANGHAWLSREQDHVAQDRPPAAPRVVTFQAHPLQGRPLSLRARMKQKASADDFLDDEATCWLSMAGLARAGVFAGDWVLLATSGRDMLVRVEMLHEWQSDVG